MEKSVEKLIEVYNSLEKESDDIYRNYALKIGCSQTELWVLYAISTFPSPCTQNDLCNSWYYSKQTIHTAVNSLLKSGYVILAQISGEKKRKQLILTEAGKIFVENNINPLRQAEMNVFLSFSIEERNQFITLFQRGMKALRKEVDSIHIGNQVDHVDKK
ncbi:MarR family transcriptional regulator [Paenibacillus jamilae]|uniref:MarR family winged helix-turn-helix transcriptional regulator n=1 Tax=Paenibacillus jamilae TaxID=114136 RepID=UPI003D2CA136